MIFGPNTLIRWLTICGLVLLCAQTSRGFTLPTLMARLAEVQDASARFTETKHVPILNIPLQSSGTLSYRAPDYIRKTTFAPARQNFVLRGNIVTLTINGKTKHFTLSQAPQLAGLVEGVRATLAGDLPTLQHYYELSLSGRLAHWQLIMRPHNVGLARINAVMCVTGAGDRITEIDSTSAKGGETIMQVDETIQNAQ
ncbi:LolA-related protein [Acidocella sp.]|uniref:LolA-related protein n=1 Tax=Acidocella sp. TaxID=50710 RepID=UPI00261B6AB4|nr:LolA-related protein [Acidocella sp.]